MLVIHPTDRTTEMLSILYRGMEVQLLDQRLSSADIRHRLNHLPKQERILLLGHGSDKGLYSRDDDTKEDFDRLIIGHPHAYYLRKHGGNIVGIWCHADLFARKEGLHGLFSGMIISELSEAEIYGVATSQEELDRENIKLAERLHVLLDEETLLSDIPRRIQALDDVHTPLTTFNYQRFYYL